MSSEVRRVVWRLEFPQPKGWRIQWLGPYTSQWLTAEAEEIVRYMEAEQCVTHPHPSDPTIFAAYPGDDRLACGCAARVLLEQWFGAYLHRGWNRAPTSPSSRCPRTPSSRTLPSRSCSCTAGLP